MKKTAIFLITLFSAHLCWGQQVSDIKTLLSSQGKALYGDEPNSLVVIDYPENIQDVAEYLAAVDVAPQQVFIDARVVEVTLAKEHALGVNWTLFADTTNGPGLDLKRHLNLGTDMTIQGAAGSAISQAIPYKNTFFPPGQTDSGKENPFTLTIFDENINMVLQTLANELKTSILSAPRITTINNREANIEVMRRLPWAQPTVTTSDTGISVSYQVNFEDVGIKLKVLPMINEDGKISMVLDPEISEKFDDFTLQVVEGTATIPYNVPIIDRRTASTKVVVGSGQTLIIGGLIKDWNQKQETKVPFLGDLPGIGWLFKSQKTIKDKTELLIFISPTIVGPAELAGMNREKVYGLGKDTNDDIVRHEQMISSMERQEESKRKDMRITVEQLSRKQQALADEHEQLQQQLLKEEVDLRNLKQSGVTVK